MTDPKEFIYNLIKNIPNIIVFQERPEILADSLFESNNAVVTFRVDRNVPTKALNGLDIRDNYSIIIDIWAKTSAQSANILALIRPSLEAYKYILDFNTDIIEADGYSHMNTRFIY